LENVDAAIAEFEVARERAEADYVRPYSGMAAAYFLKARYLPEETAECVEWYDLDTLFQALDYIDLANEQRDPSASLPVVNATKLLNEARVTYALCAMGISGALEDEAQSIQLCEQFDAAVDELVDSYVEAPNPSVAPFAANAYGFRGDIQQLRGDFNAAIEDYQRALEIDEMIPYQRMVYTRYLGDAYSWLCQLEQASQNYEAALALALDLGYEAMAETYEALRDDMDNMIQENECE
jgi:tetratricopeptide (TPR) repeat protein